ncbi:MAG: hypothetical protein AB8B56_05465, partial [Crocinitomicaceae bacterium]
MNSVFLDILQVFYNSNICDCFGLKFHFKGSWKVVDYSFEGVDCSIIRLFDGPIIRWLDGWM